MTVHPPEPGLTPGEQALLLDAQTDDVAFVWVLDHLGLTGDELGDDWRPSATVIESAFNALERLQADDLIEVGRWEYVDGGPPGRNAPERLVPESLAAVRRRVEMQVAQAQAPTDWWFACWVFATVRPED